jgi:hypothetical protein
MMLISLAARRRSQNPVSQSGAAMMFSTRTITEHFRSRAGITGYTSSQLVRKSIRTLRITLVLANWRGTLNPARTLTVHCSAESECGLAYGLASKQSVAQLSPRICDKLLLSALMAGSGVNEAIGSPHSEDCLPAGQNVQLCRRAVNDGKSHMRDMDMSPRQGLRARS